MPLRDVWNTILSRSVTACALCSRHYQPTPRAHPCYGTVQQTFLEQHVKERTTH